MELLLYDGTTTLNLADGVAFGVPYDEWTPNVARRRLDVLGGRSPYEPVEERIPLHARGATGAEALGHVQTLARMMDQAARWWRGDVGVTAVQLWYKPTGSTLGGYLKNSVVPNGRGGMVGLSPRVNDASNYEIPGLSLDVLRVEGQWLFDAYDVENHCLNSSFEVFDGTDFANWTKIGSVTLSQVAGFVHGRYAARIDSTAGAGGVYQDIPLGTGVTATLSITIRIISGAGTVRVRAYDYSSFSNPVDSSSVLSGTERVSVTRAEGGGGLRFYARADAGMVLEIDAAMAEEGSVATEYHPNSDDVFVATVAETGNPNVLAADWSVSGIAGNDCPLSLALTGLENYNSRYYDDGALVHVTGDVIEPLIIEAEDCTPSAPGGGTFASAVVSGARGGDVMRLTPGAVGDYTLVYNLPSGTVGQRWAVFALLKQATSGAVGYAIDISFDRNTIEGVGRSLPLYLGASDFDGNPNYVSLGMIATSQPEVTKFTLTFTPTATSATVLDVDFVVLAAIDDDGGVLGLPAWLGANVIVYRLEASSQALLAPVPLVSAVSETGTPTTLSLAHRGNAYLTQRGYTFSLVPLLKQGADWLYQESGGGEYDFTLTATRKLAFLTPE